MYCEMYLAAFVTGIVPVRHSHQPGRQCALRLIPNVGARFQTFHRPPARDRTLCVSTSRPEQETPASPTSSAVSQASPQQRISSRTGTVLVTGKFDTFHRGHRELVRVAAELGHPTLLSFSGMAAALQWRPRAPVVAPVERDRILRQWAFEMSAPVSWKTIPFDDVRDMSPSGFLDFVRDRLGVSAIVCGTDWRFGKNAKGDVTLLEQLASEKDLQVRVVNPVHCHSEAVSSTRVRAALADGNVELAAELMDRPHRLVGYVSSLTKDSVSCFHFVNQVPGEGMYSALIRVIGAAQPVRSYVSVRHSSSTSSDATERPPTVVTIYDATQIYCEDCEVYIDFTERIR